MKRKMELTFQLNQHIKNIILYHIVNNRFIFIYQQ